MISPDFEKRRSSEIVDTDPLKFRWGLVDGGIRDILSNSYPWLGDKVNTYIAPYILSFELTEKQEAHEQDHENASNCESQFLRSSI